MASRVLLSIGDCAGDGPGEVRSQLDAFPFLLHFFRPSFRSCSLYCLNFDHALARPERTMTYYLQDTIQLRLQLQVIPSAPRRSCSDEEHEQGCNNQRTPLERSPRGDGPDSDADGPSLDFSGKKPSVDPLLSAQ